jgi:hypothetical protein
MPVFEAHVRPLEIDEEVVWIETRCRARGAVRARLGWWRLINAVVNQMTIIVSRMIDETWADTYPLTAGVLPKDFSMSRTFKESTWL